MLCQQMLRKAKRQLLSICILLEKRRQFSYHKTHLINHETFKNFAILSHRHFTSLRCFSSVPPPPYIDDNSSVERTVNENQRQCKELDDIISVNHERLDDRSEEGVDGDNCEEERHVPVMVEEVLSCLDPQDNQVVVDMTFGAGGHARRILKSSPNVRYIGVDRDPTAFGFAKEFATQYKAGQVIPLLSKFSELPVHLAQMGVKPGTVDCILMDLGVSSMQFDSAGRGFSLSRDGPLDMRMDGLRFPENPTAADVVNTLEPHELARILKKYGEEKMARPIAHAIVEARYAFGMFTRTKQLADVIKSVFDSNYRHDKLHRHSHVATKTFQALRIFINDELNEVHNGLEVAHRYLKPNGRCAVISFHSLEDRIVKRHFHGIDMDLDANMSIHSYFRNSRISYDNAEIKDRYLVREWHPMKRKILEPSIAEVSHNPRSRSAKLRAAVKVAKS